MGVIAFDNEKESRNVSLKNVKIYTGTVGQTADLTLRGYLEGGVTVDFGGQIYTFEAGIPVMAVRKWLLAASIKTKGKFVELTPANLAMVMGMAESLLKVWSGSEEFADWWQADIDDQELLTFKKIPGSTYEQIHLDLPGLVTEVDVPVFSDPDTETPWVKGTDYFYDAQESVIYRIPTAAENANYNGGIASEGQIRCKYKCIPPAGTELRIGQDVTSWEGALLIEGECVETGRHLELYHPKAMTSSGGLTTNEKAAWGLDFEMEPVHYPTTPTEPLGYFSNDIEIPA